MRFLLQMKALRKVKFAIGKCMLMSWDDENRDYKALCDELDAFYKRVEQVQSCDKKRHHVVFKSSKGVISKIKKMKKLFTKSLNH